jgi:hypothetical protein
MNSTLVLLLVACGKTAPSIEPPGVTQPSVEEITSESPETPEVATGVVVCVEECVSANMASPLPAERIRQDCESACAGERGLLGEDLLDD